jgi:hypothetical protein
MKQIYSTAGAIQTLPGLNIQNANIGNVNINIVKPGVPLTEPMSNLLTNKVSYGT